MSEICICAFQLCFIFQYFFHCVLICLRQQTASAVINRALRFLSILIIQESPIAVMSVEISRADYRQQTHSRNVSQNMWTDIFCFSIVSNKSASSVPVPPCSESLTVFLIEQSNNSFAVSRKIFRPYYFFFALYLKCSEYCFMTPYTQHIKVSGCLFDNSVLLSRGLQHITSPSTRNFFPFVLYALPGILTVL